jgi:hypothetical protein
VDDKSSLINEEVKSIDVEELWSRECLVDELFLCLARKREEITLSRGKTIRIRSYYCQARELMKWLPIARPAPGFVINASDLSRKVIEELEVRADNPDDIGYILRQAVGRIFENLNDDYYHRSIARSLKVRLEP